MAVQEGVEVRLEWFEEFLDFLSDLLEYLDERRQKEEAFIRKAENELTEIGYEHGIKLDHAAMNNMFYKIETIGMEDEILDKAFKTVGLKPIYLFDEEEPYVIYIPIEISGEKRYIQVGPEGWIVCPPSMYDTEELDEWFEDILGTSEPVISV